MKRKTLQMRAFAIVGLMLGGCSLTFVARPTDAGQQTSCTESRAAPIVDSVLGAGLVAAGVASLSIPASTLPDGEGLARVSGVAALVASAVFVISAVSGFSSTSECRRLHDE